LANLSMGVVTSGGSTGAASAGGEVGGADGGVGTEAAPGTLASGTTGMVCGCCADAARGNTIASAEKSAMSTRPTMFEALQLLTMGLNRPNWPVVGAGTTPLKSWPSSQSVCSPAVAVLRRYLS